MWVYPQITLSSKFLLLCPDPEEDKMNFKIVSLQIWDTPKNVKKYSSALTINFCILTEY